MTDHDNSFPDNSSSSDNHEEQAEVMALFDDGDDDERASASHSAETSTVQIPLIWRVVAIIVAAVIIVALLWPLFTQEPEAPTTITSNNVPEAPQLTGSAEELFQQGQEYYLAGQFDQAIQVYQRVVELDPNHQSAYVNLGDSYYQKSQLDQAIEAYQKAIDLDPDDADVAYNMGAALLQQAVGSGQFDQEALQKAIDQITHATELNPQLPHPYYGLGEAYNLLGDTEQAIQNFERFLELDNGSDNQATTIAQDRLEQLKSAQGE